jgi:recombination-promoting nuclease RpnB
MSDIVKENSVHKAHDRAFKAAMRDLRVARDFLIHYLPLVIKDKIDLSTLQLCKESFVDPELRELITDMMYSADFKGQDGATQKAFLYLCLEHQRDPDPLMAWRMIKYTSCMIDQHLLETNSKELPIVIPIVLYNGDSVYHHSVEVFDLFGKNKELAKQFMFNRFQLIDLNQIPDEAIRQHQWSGLMEMLMKHVYARDIMVYLEQLSEIVKHLVFAKANDYLLSMIKYLIEKSEIPNRDAFYHWVQSHLSPPLEVKTMTTLAEQWKAEGRAEVRSEVVTLAEQWKAEGRAEVTTLAEQFRQEGTLIGERRLLTTQLSRRFPHLIQNYRDKINHADEKTLQSWGEKILDAKAINDVFEE